MKKHVVAKTIVSAAIYITPFALFYAAHDLIALLGPFVAWGLILLLIGGLGWGLFRYEVG